MKVYFDYASTTPLLPPVKEIMLEVMDHIHGNPSSIHSFGRKAKTMIEASRKIIAESLNASLGEVFFTAGATESNNLVLQACVADLQVTRIISTQIEHHCILHTLDKIAKDNPQVEIILLPVNEDAQISLTELEKTLGESQKKTLVTIMHANNELGTMNDIQAISKLCQEHNTLFHSDIAQTFGKYKFDVQEMKIDFLAASAHKLYAPKGNGFVYINADHAISPMLFGGSQERNMRAGTENVMGICAFGKATEIAYEELEERHRQVDELRNYFEKEIIESIPGSKINGTREGMHLYNISSISFPPMEHSDMMVFNLDIAGIAISSGSACSSGVENDSHVLEAIGHDPQRKTIRFSLSHLMKKEEIDYTIETLKKICL